MSGWRSFRSPHLWSRRVVTASRDVKNPSVFTGGCVTCRAFHSDKFLP